MAKLLANRGEPDQTSQSVFIPCHTIVVGYYGIPSSVCPSIRTWFLDNSSYSFHQITLKLGGQLDYGVVQRILFRGDSTPDFDKSYYYFLTICWTLTLFQNNSYSFNPIKLKHGGQLNYEVLQGYSTQIYLFIYFFLVCNLVCFLRLHYRKCPKILNTKDSDKIAHANSADPDQTVPEGAVWSGSTLFATPQNILRFICIKSKI